MTDRVSPWNRPGARELRTLLGGDPKSDTILTTVIESLDLDTLAALSGLVVAMFSAAVRDGAKVGRLEALEAVQAVIDEVDGGQR